MQYNFSPQDEGCNKMTYLVQNFSHEIQEVGRHIKATKKIYSWKFDVCMDKNSYIKDNCLDRSWNKFEVIMIDSLVTKKKTVRVNDIELLVDEYW